jgi:hypothetical protein
VDGWCGETFKGFGDPELADVVCSAAAGGGGGDNMQLHAKDPFPYDRRTGHH